MDRKLVLLIALGIVLYGANIWGTSVYILDEAKNAGCAMEMYQRGDWVVPTFNVELRTDKPPLHYFFMKAAYNVFGVNPFSARLFSVFMGVMLIAVVYLFVRSIYDKTVAFFSSLILATSLQLCIQFHLAVPDPYLIFFLTLGLLSFYKGYQYGQPRFLYLFYVAISLAVLAKGPVAIVFSGLIVFLFLLLQKKFSFRTLLDIKLIQGILIFCVIVLPWYIAVGIETNGEWLRRFFFEHNVGRFTSTMEGHGGFPLASFVIVFAALIPFSFFAPQAVTYAWKQRKQDSFLFFCLIAVGVVCIFFAFSRTILPSYPEPAVPFFAITMGLFFARAVQAGGMVKSFKRSAVAYVILAVLLPIAAYIALTQDKSLAPVSYVSVYFIVLPAGAVAGWLFIRKGNLTKALYSYAVSAALFLLVFFYAAFPPVDTYNPVVQSLAVMEHKEDAAIVYYKRFNPSFVFMLRQVVPPASSPEAMQELRAQHDLVYVLTQKRYLKELDALHYDIVHEGRDLFESPTTVVLRLKK